MTTCPERIRNGLLKQTLDSLKDAGFYSPIIFVDGPVAPRSLVREYEWTCRSKPLRVAGHWMMSAQELFLRNPWSEFYAIFQDDLLAVRNLRQYLEQVPFPKDGYYNLYNYPANEEINHKGVKGFYLSNQKGKGAVALVFSNEGLKALLTCKRFINRSTCPGRGFELVDGGIVESMKLAGFREFVHNPSLVTHVGDESTCGHGKFSKPKTFPGESFDALTLHSVAQPAPQPQTKPGKGLGYIGYSCQSGLGELSRQISEYVDIAAWLVVPHRNYEQVCAEKRAQRIITAEPRNVKLRELVNRVETVLFCETPYYQQVIKIAKDAGRRLVCVPMLEWTPTHGWVEDVDLFLCPTRACYHALKGKLPCSHFHWPFDVSRFPFRLRHRCERFLFINGHGGCMGRKGAAVIRAAKEIWPEMPLTVYSQANETWPEGTRVLPPPASNVDLYRDADVLLAPHSIDGLGLELREAICSGMPVVATRGKPWNELPLIAEIDAKVTKKKVRRPVEWYEPDAASLVSICQELYLTDISQQSEAVRQHAESYSWEKRVGTLKSILNIKDKICGT